MPLSDGLAIAGLALAAVTAIGVVATAVVTILSRRDTTLYNLPTLSVQQGVLLDGSAWIDFEIKSVEGRPSWGVVSIDLPRNWRRRRFLCDGLDFCPHRDPRMWHPQGIPFDFKDDASWRRRIIYDLPITRIIALIHSDAPDPLAVRYNICLSSAPRKRTSLVERYRLI